MAAPDPGIAEPATASPRRVLWRWVAWIATGVVLLAALAAATLLALNTGPGKGFVAQRISGFETESGLNFRVGRIDGSIFGRMMLHDVEVRDTKGAFLVIPEVTLDWSPAALLRKRVEVRELSAGLVRMLRKPLLKPTAKDPNKPLLPDIDIRAERVRLDRIVLEPAVTGRRHIANLIGSADLADGRLRLDVQASALTGPGIAGGDRLQTVVDIVPKANRLRVDLDVQAPADGLVVSYLQLSAPLTVKLGGKGDWRAWGGQALAQLGDARLAQLRLSARDGQFTITGPLWVGALVKGGPTGLLEPPIALDASVAIAARRLNGRLDLRSDAFTLAITGGADLGANRFLDVAVQGRLLQAGALAKNLSAKAAALDLKLDGPFARPSVDYRLSADALAFGKVRAEGLRAEGRTRIDAERILIPVKAEVRRIDGLGAVTGGPLANLRLSGDLAFSNGRLLSDNLRLRSDRIDATTVVLADLKTGLYTGALKGRVNDFALEGVGRFNLVTDAKLTAGRDGGFGIKGSVRVTSQKLDNATLRDLLGGQGVLSAEIALKPDGAIQLTDLRLRSPQFQIVRGSGLYGADQTLRADVAAQSTRYGPLDLSVRGTAQRPIARLTAPHPDIGLPLTDVIVQVVGEDGGYRAELSGGSPYGPFSGRGVLRTGKPMTVDLASLRIAGIEASGRVVQSVAGPFEGTLNIAGSGLSGALRLSAAGEMQKVLADISANGARLPLSPPITIANGRLTATALMGKAGPDLRGDISVSGLRRQGLTLTSGRAKFSYGNGRGELGLVVRGRSPTPFDISGQARLQGETLLANARGAINGIGVRLAAPAEIRKVDDSWRLTPTRVVLPEGEILLSGQTGAQNTVSATLLRVDLGLVQAFAPSLALVGEASGQIDARLPKGGGIPSATARLEVTGFSRVALATASPPVDLAVQAGLSPDAAHLEALIKRGDATIGRLQARAAPLAPAAGPWTARLTNAPLSGGVRYSGPSDVLWAMTGIAGHNVSGAIAIAADLGGRVRQPSLDGVLRADALRYENPAFGTVISGIAIRGRFTQSRLEVTSLTGRAGRGQVTARGWVGLDAAAGFPMDVRATLQDAQLASSDTVGASVSGSLAITNSRTAGGRIEGELRIPEARYQIVRQGAAQVAVLEGVRRRGGLAPINDDEETPKAGGLPRDFQLDIRVRAPNRIFLGGMGLEGEWGADLRVRGPATNPSVTGTLDLVRGTFSFAGRRLDLSKADVRFDGGQVANPLLDIAASTTVEGVTATVNVGGRAQNPQISFTSTPALPQDEVLSRLLFGESVGQLSPTQAIQVAAALNSLRNGGGGLNPLGKLRSMTSLDRLRILGSDQATGRGTALAAGAYLGRNIYVEIITDARGFTATQFEIALSRALSLLIRTSSFAGSSVELQYSKDY